MRVSTTLAMSALLVTSAAAAGDLKIFDVGLGLRNKITCQLEQAYDGIHSCFDADRNLTFRTNGEAMIYVVQAVRSQVLTSDDPSPKQVLEKAIEYYGPPASYDEEKLVVTHGDAFDTTGDDATGPSGQGLAITVATCDDQPIACRRAAGAEAVVLYNLLDRDKRDALKARYAHEKKDIEDASKKQKLDGMKF